MRISEIYNLNKTQFELDFVDIDPNKDLSLFLDPYFISKMDFPFAEDAYRYLKSFFDYLLNLLRSNRRNEAEEIFSYLGENNEICLGMSKGTPSGKGMGPTDATKIFRSLIYSKAYQTGLMEDIEDFRIFVPNVDKDKVSDMTSNIIKQLLIKYTQEQCLLWGIQLTYGVPTGNFWDRETCEWRNEYTKMLIINGKKIILVPKRIVSFSKEYTESKYLQHFVLNYLQQEHLKLQSSLVRKRVKTKEEYVTKKDVKKYELSRISSENIDKSWLAEFTLAHPEVFKEFKTKTIDKISHIKNNDLTDVAVSDVTNYLINQLKTMSVGKQHATDYHRLIVGIMELLFYPYLANPAVEEKIHDGRKRIDITFDNCAETGFFFRLSTSYNIPSRLIMIECKNYNEDLTNPELDQLSGRFSPNRGQFGISACRSFKNEDMYISRCNDTQKDGRGTIIPLTDEDFIDMLEKFPSEGYAYCDQLMQNKFRKVSIN